MGTFFMGVILAIGFGYSIIDMLKLEGYEIGLFILFTLVVFFFLNGMKRKVIDNREYYLSPLYASSIANFNQQTGIRWTRKADVLSKGDVYIDNYRYNFDVKRRFSVLHELLFSKTKKMYKESLAFTRGSLIIGSMGSGKTVFINTLLLQSFYIRALIHDIKGDFVEKIYNRGNDIILNPFDKRGQVWDIFSEAENFPKIIDSFFDTLLTGVMGGNNEGNKSFFTSSAKDRFVKIFMKAHNLDLDSKEKWKIAIEMLKAYEIEVAESTQKSEKDIYSTMKLLLEYIEFIGFLVIKGAKIFTIQQFLESKNCKLFLLNNPTYSEFLTPYFSAFIDSFTKIFMAKMPETKEDFTLLMLDEYLSFLPLLNEQTKTILHTLIRSKGGLLVPAIQYLPEHKNLRQQLLNSAENMYIFQTSDIATVQAIKDLIGKVEYRTESENETLKSTNKSYSTTIQYLLGDNTLKEIGKKYEHITFVQSNQNLYLGYTPMTEQEKINSPFVEGYYKKFINLKFKREAE